MAPSTLLAHYDAGGFWCELTGGSGQPATHAAPIVARLNALDLADLRRRAADAEQELYNLGITFTLYGANGSADRILPFDLIPRVLSATEWARLEAGLIQRVSAINLFVHDVYNRQHVLKDRVVPAELVLGNPCYRPEMADFEPPCGTYAHVCGIDLVRDAAGTLLVLEDNARTPSGVSYVVENRHMMARVFPDLFGGLAIRSVGEYGPRLLAALSDLAPEGVLDPRVVLMSPGSYNSAYFEHVFLAREMGVPLVEGHDLEVEDDRVWMRTVAGLAPVHVIYRRLDDAFLDPAAFDPDSLIGVRGLFAAYRKGNVAIANAVGTGIADDKATYAYLPRLIEYYLGQSAIIPNVDTHLCRESKSHDYVREHLAELVLKPVGGSGGYGIVVGPKASAAELAEARARLDADPAGFIAQPVVALSVCPTLTDDGIAPRHVDLRPFVVTGRQSWVLPGGLTRVALRQGSLVVNSSQGGGSKDTWVLAETRPRDRS